MTDLTPADRAAKVAKITALLLKTEANGCTPEEAASAQRLANTLCTKYSIAPSECRPVERSRPAPPRNQGYTPWFDTAEPGSPFYDFLQDFMRQYASPRPPRREATPEEKREQARQAYRREGVHVDPAYHPQCTCTKCNRQRERAAQRARYADAADAAAQANEALRKMAEEAQKARQAASGFRPQDHTYSPNPPRRPNFNHFGCTHGSTKAERARCRRERGA